MKKRKLVFIGIFLAINLVGVAATQAQKPWKKERLSYIKKLAKNE